MWKLFTNVKNSNINKPLFYKVLKNLDSILKDDEHTENLKYLDTTDFHW